MKNLLLKRNSGVSFHDGNGFLLMRPGKVVIQTSDFGSQKSVLEVIYSCYQDAYDRIPEDNPLCSQYRIRLDQLRSKLTQHINSSIQVIPANMEINPPMILPSLQSRFAPEPKPEHYNPKNLNDQIDILLNDVSNANNKELLTENRHQVLHSTNIQQRSSETDNEFKKLKEIDNYCKEKTCAITEFLEMNQREYPSSEISQAEKAILSKIILVINP